MEQIADALPPRLVVPGRLSVNEPWPVLGDWVDIELIAAGLGREHNPLVARIVIPNSLGDTYGGFVAVFSGRNQEDVLWTKLSARVNGYVSSLAGETYGFIGSVELLCPIGLAVEREGPEADPQPDEDRLATLRRLIWNTSDMHTEIHRLEHRIPAADQTLLWVHPSAVLRVLRRFLAGGLPPGEVSTWARAVLRQTDIESDGAVQEALVALVDQNSLNADAAKRLSALLAQEPNCEVLIDTERADRD